MVNRDPISRSMIRLEKIKGSPDLPVAASHGYSIKTLGIKRCEWKDCQGGRESTSAASIQAWSWFGRLSSTNAASTAKQWWENMHHLIPRTMLTIERVSGKNKTCSTKEATPNPRSWWAVHTCRCGLFMPSRPPGTYISVQCWNIWTPSEILVPPGPYVSQRCPSIRPVGR